MENSFGEILVPTEEVLEIKEGQKKRSERKYFPGYVMIKMDLNDDTWHLVKNHQKFLALWVVPVKSLFPLKKSEAENLIQSMREDSSQPRPKVMFETGEIVGSLMVRLMISMEK